MLEGFVEIELVLQAKSTDGHREERFFVRFFHLEFQVYHFPPGNSKTQMPKLTMIQKTEGSFFTCLFC